MLQKDLIKKFYEIRNIPFHISIDGEPGFDCEDKAKMFIETATTLGFEARMRVGLFDWKNIALPSEIATIPHDKSCSHMFAEIKNRNKVWVFVDLTWNPELFRAGFAITEWDGINSTEFAMVLKEILPLEKTAEYLRSIDRVTDMKENSKFYEALNFYCDEFLGGKQYDRAI
jgi:hypothetical protein